MRFAVISFARRHRCSTKPASQWERSWPATVLPPARHTHVICGPGSAGVTSTTSPRLGCSDRTSSCGRERWKRFAVSPRPPSAAGCLPSPASTSSQ
jgi:hypothetical protein